MNLTAAVFTHEHHAVQISPGDIHSTKQLRHIRAPGVACGNERRELSVAVGFGELAAIPSGGSKSKIS